MNQPDATHNLTRDDLQACLRLLSSLEHAVHSPEEMLRACMDGLADLVAHSQARCVAGSTEPADGDSTANAWTLTLCDEPSHHARVVLTPARGRFSERDVARLALIAPHVVFLYAQACRNAQRPPAWMLRVITPREQEVLGWVSCGKTDADIAGLLAISPRTVQKHLEHIYVKLGVETRTAAAMRARGAD